MIFSRASLLMAKAAAALTAVAAAWSCSGGGGDVPVPRRTGYPRIAVLDSVYEAPAGMPLHIEINRGANAVAAGDSVSSGWYDIVYPAYKATLYVTFTPVNAATVDEVLDNRAERMSLNAGAGVSEVIELQSAGGEFNSRILRTPSSSTTPLQFIASDGERWVVSGALFFHDAQAVTSVDSVAPVVDAVTRDVIHAMKTMTTR